VAGNECRLQSVNLKLGDRRQELGGSQGGDSDRLCPHQRHGYIVQALRESDSGPPVATLVAIGVAAAAVVVITSFLFISYVKFKKFSATSKKSRVSEAAVA
jgi:hypothetical protein